MSRKDFFNGCFPANWVELDVTQQKQDEAIIKSTNTYVRKDVATLLAELEEIKNSFERIQEKQLRLQNLMKFYRGELAT